MVSGAPDPTDVERLGKGLFGRALRLRVGLWVLEELDNGSTFFQSEAALGVKYSVSGVVAELDRLVSLGMVQRHEPTDGDRRVYYSPIESSYWGVVRAAAAALDIEEIANSE